MSNGFNDIPSTLIEYIVKHTRLPRRDVIAVLRAERRYYLENLTRLNSEIET